MRQGCLLYLEDDEIIRENFTELFKLSGYNVIAVSAPEQAIGVVDSNEIDVAVIDLELNGDMYAGIHVCKDLRNRFSTLPILLLSAHNDTALQEVAFLNGADDYLDKNVPFSLLMARLNRLVKRITDLSDEPVTHKSSSFLGLEFKGAQQAAYWMGHRLELNPAQLAILKTLYEGRGEVVSVTDLMEAMNVVIEPTTVVSHIGSIREQFLTLNPKFNAIKTVRGKGFTWTDSR